MIVSEMVLVRLSRFKLRGKHPSQKDLIVTGSWTPKYVQVGIPFFQLHFKALKLLQTCPTLSTWFSWFSR